jgi:hypothetical protein
MGKLKAAMSSAVQKATAAKVYVLLLCPTTIRLNFRCCLLLQVG